VQQLLEERRLVSALIVASWRRRAFVSDVTRQPMEASAVTDTSCDHRRREQSRVLAVFGPILHKVAAARPRASTGLQQKEGEGPSTLSSRGLDSR
jgi:hypothetical protein